MTLAIRLQDRIRVILKQYFYESVVSLYITALTLLILLPLPSFPHLQDRRTRTYSSVGPQSFEQLPIDGKGF